MANDENPNGKLYEMICKDRFDKIDNHLESISALLRGKNGDPGVVDDVRGLKKFNKYVCGVFVFLACTGVVQLFRWVFTKI